MCCIARLCEITYERWLALRPSHHHGDAEERNRQMTEAQTARIIAKINRLAAQAMAETAEGMWNPNFCARDCSAYALSLKADFQRLVDQLDPPRSADRQGMRG